MNAVIFDMDGVIFDTERIWIECWSPVGQAHNIEGIEKILRDECVGITAAAMKAALQNAYGADFPYDDYVKEASAIFHARYDHNLPMKPGVRELFDYLTDIGAPIALASSTPTKTVRRELGDANLLPYFTVITGGEEVSRSKPAPDIFLLAARKLDWPPAECFVIEDSFNGIRAAHAAGMRPIMVPDLLAPDAEMQSLAEAILPSLNDAIAYFKKTLELTRRGGNHPFPFCKGGFPMGTRPIASLIYDFDKTLSPNNMQEYGFLRGLKIEPAAFWAECRAFAIENRMDGVLAYMYKMKEKAEGVMELSKDVFRKLGGDIEFFPGVSDWFDRVNAYGASLGLDMEHYIISSGLTEIIEGSAIARHFREIFAASYCYDADGRPLWPSSAVNYTSKTQFLFRINKGILDVTNDNDLNGFTPEDRRRVPFRNMIYVGDGLTDVPSMKLTRSKGGFSIAVHPPGDTKLVDDMLLQNRVDFALTADYSAGGELERVVQAILRQIVAVDECARLHAAHLDGARRRIDEREAKPVAYEETWMGTRE